MPLIFSAWAPAVIIAAADHRIVILADFLNDFYTFIDSRTRSNSSCAP
jgi:hypothetical protein